jgi:flagellar FliJ protein
VKKSERIQKLADIEALKGAELGSRLQAAQRQYLEECRKLKQLQTYREEYADRFDASGKQGMSALQLADFSRFVQKLDEALDNQREAVNQQTFRLEQVRGAWQENYQKVDGLTKVGDAARREEAKEERKREFMRIDDRISSSLPNPTMP